MADADDPLAEEYRGEAWVVTGDRAIPVRAHLSGHFEPIDGTYRWAGRIDPDDEVTGLFAAGRRAVAVRTPGGHESTGTLVEQDPWGGCRVAGTGRPPFPIPDPPGLPDPHPLPPSP